MPPLRQHVKTRLLRFLLGITATSAAFLSPVVGQHHEHDLIMDLVDDAWMTDTALASGNWSDPATWGGTMPQAGARIVIPAGITVSVASKVPDTFMSVRVDGTLRFEPTARRSELRVDTMVVSATGVFEMGTPAQPIPGNHIAKLVFDDYNGEMEVGDPQSPDYDPLRVGQGLISFGRMTVHGQVKTPWASLAIEPMAGNQSLELDVAPVAWKRGDVIVIAGTSRDGLGHEVRRISQVVGKTVYLAPETPTLMLHNTYAALEKDHLTPIHTRAGLQLKVHVINTTRNAVFETAKEHREPTQINGTDEMFFGRGHVMIHNNNADFYYASFNHMGRANKMFLVDDPIIEEDGTVSYIGDNPRARYSLHYHRGGIDGQMATVQGVSVTDSPGWGVVNHSSYVQVTDSVAFDVDGAAFVSEAGNERGLFTRNVSIYSKGSGKDVDNRKSPDRDFGHGGHGFWIQSPYIHTYENISSGAGDYDYGIYNLGFDGHEKISVDYSRNPEFYKVDTQIRGHQLPIMEFRDNLSYGSMGGLMVGHQHARLGLVKEYNEILNFVAFAVDTGIEFRYNFGTHVLDGTFIGDLTDPQGLGFYRKTGNAQNFLFDRCHFEGFDTGFQSSRQAHGNFLRNSYLDNNTNIHLKRHEIGITHDIRISNVTFGPNSIANLMVENNYGLNREHIGLLMVPSRIVLDRSDGVYEVFFKMEQDPDFIPYPSSLWSATSHYSSTAAGFPDELKDKTNLELFNLSVQDREYVRDLLSNYHTRTNKPYTDPDYAQDTFPGWEWTTNGFMLPVGWQNMPEYIVPADMENVVLYKIAESGNFGRDPVAFTDLATVPNTRDHIDIYVMDNDIDPDGDTFDIATYVRRTLEGGRVSKIYDSLRYHPPEGFVGTDTFEYEILDTWGGRATGTVLVHVTAN
ncbi:MAG: hypothetical protein DWQ01_02405 [Planctomycetota bacterium]|nr:MAG: hypothetical protein DWQ01_02405 [Planctomycetota bacterium]